MRAPGTAADSFPRWWVSLRCFASSRRKRRETGWIASPAPPNPRHQNAISRQTTSKTSKTSKTSSSRQAHRSYSVQKRRESDIAMTSSATRALLAEQTLLDGRFQPDMAVLHEGG